MLSERVDQSVMSSYGHKERMSGDILVKRIYGGVDGTGGRGRPRTRWLDGVRKVLGERGMTIQHVGRYV